MNVKQGEIFLVPFPFSDLSGSKVRPVVIISNDGFNFSSEDVLVSGITSNTSKDNYAVQITNKDMGEGHLIVNSSVKVENILRIEKKLLMKKIGSLKKETFLEIIKKLKAIF